MSTRTTTLLLLMLAIGCSPDGKAPNSGDMNDDADPYTDNDTGDDGDITLSLHIELDAESTPAGEAVGFTVEAHDDDGASTEVEEYTLISDIEGELVPDGSTLTFTVAGTHDVQVEAEINEEAQIATAVIEVTAGALTDIDLTLATTEIAAGEPLDFEVTGSDAYGNAVDIDDVELTADSSDIVIDSSTATSTVAGDYILKASSGDVSDEESFQVVAADPESVTLELSETELEEGDSADALVSILDAYGNAVETDWTLTVEGTGTVTVDAEEITFDEEGVYTITVTVDGTELTDSIEITIDSHGPVLDISNPDRGHWTTSPTLTMAGTVTDNVTGVASLAVNGTALSWDEDGAFSTDLDLEFGVQVIETIASDLDPNVTDDARAVLQADTFWSATSPMDGGIIVRLNEGEGGLDTISELAEEAISVDTLSSMVTGTLLSDEYCIGSGWFEVCTSYEVRANTVSVSDLDIEIDTSSGLVRVIATLYDVDVNGQVYTSITGWDSWTLHVDTMETTALLNVSVGSGGALNVDVDSVSVATSGLSFDAGGAAGAIEAVAEFFGYDVDEEVEDRLVNAMEDTIEDAVPGLIEDTLGSVEVSESFEFSGNEYTVTGTLSSVEVLYRGIELWMSTTVNADDEVAAFADIGPAGSPYAAYGSPTFAGTDGGAEMAISLDFANQALRAFWAGGMIDTQMTDEELGIDMAAISLVLPGLSDLTLVTQATLPPLVVPYTEGEEGENVQLQVGDLFVQIYDGEVSEETLYMELYVSAMAPATLGTSAAGDEIIFNMGDPAVTVDVVYPDGSSPRAAGAESAFAILLPVFLPEITSAFGEIPIPEFAGFSLSSVSTEMIGTGGAQGYLGMSGSLELE